MIPNTYTRFCKYVKETFFTNDKKGELFMLVIDDEFIDNACKTISVEEKELFQSVKAMMCTHENNTFDHIIGILAIQIYAAFHRQTDEKATNKAYYIRLSDLLKIPQKNLEEWMKYEQDKYWKIFYNWCRQNDFYTCDVKAANGAYRYVNYPLSQALLNREDLKAMRCIFNKCYLRSGEDIPYEDFKSILFPFNSDDYRLLTPHFGKLHKDRKKTEHINLQIYYYYLHWGGHYEEKERNKTITLSPGSLEYSLNLTNDLTQLEIRDKYINCRKTIKLKNADFGKDLKGYYHFKREDKILFAQNHTYNDWDETRFIPKGETGLLLDLSPPYGITFQPGIKIRKRGKGWILCEITEGNYSEYYSKGEKIYALEGGLRITSNTWMLGTPPFLIFKKTTEFWLNGNKYLAKEGALAFSSLVSPSEGTYTLKVPQNKVCEFTIAKPEKTTDYAPCGWKLQNTSKAFCWNPNTSANIIGLDYSQLMPETNEENPLKQWINEYMRTIIITSDNHKNISKIQLHNS